MPSPYIITPTTSVSGAGIGISDPVAGVIVFISTGGYLIETGTPSGIGVFLTGGNANVTVDGYVSGVLSGITVGDYVTGGSDTGGNNVVTIGASGHVAAAFTGTSGNSAIFGAGGDNSITNHGDISGQWTGITVTGVGNAVVNTGRITSGNHGIFGWNDEGIVGGSIVNSGAITAENRGIWVEGFYSIANSGTISAEVAEGIYATGTDNAIDNSGSIDSAEAEAIRLESVLGGNNSVLNSGLVRSRSFTTAAISDGTGNSTVTNSGRIEQTGGYAIAVSLGDGQDILTNLATGSIAGDIDLGGTDGNADTLTNLGTVTGNVTSGNGADSVINHATGAINGNVDLAGTDISNDALINAGTITGNALTGDGSDTVLNTGLVTGNVDLGNGDGYADTLTNDGTINGSVTAALHDTILNRAGATIGGNINHTAASAGTTFTVRNDGAIGGAVVVAAAVNSIASLVNSGTLAGGIITTFSNDTLDNFGTIGADVFLANGADTVTNTGQILGALDLGDLDNYNDTLANYGLIDGTVTASFADTIVNHAGATIAGNVANTLAFAGLTHSVTNHGFIGGNVTSAGVSGSLVAIGNTGTIAGGVTTASGIDNVANSGSIGGAVALGDGADTLTNSGTIAGNVDMGAATDIDVLVNTGMILGTVNMGFGNDVVDNALGAITGTVSLSTGSDTYTGGAGTDRVAGGNGNDEIDLGAGDDYFFFQTSSNDGNDTIDGGDGVDLYSAAATTLAVAIDLDAGTVSGSQAGLDVISGFENAIGGNKNDTLSGSDDANRLDGHAGNDSIDGGAGNDRLIGNTGNDTLIGGAGRDVMTGGSLAGSSDADRFVLLSVSDSGVTAATRDVITDFTDGSDKIDLSAIDANSGAVGNQAFSFNAVDGAAFSGAAGSLIWKQSGAYAIVSGDTNGDSVADFTLQLNGTHALLATDFIL